MKLLGSISLSQSIFVSLSQVERQTHILFFIPENQYSFFGIPKCQIEVTGVGTIEIQEEGIMREKSSSMIGLTTQKKCDNY